MISDIIILVGGFGRRLQSISQEAPKPLMPVGSRVFLDFVLDWISKYNIRKVILSIYYKPDFFQAYLDRRSFPFEIVTIVEPVPMGTGGAIKFTLDNVDVSDAFCVVNGDTFLDFNLNVMFESFISLQCSAMIGLSYVKNAERYGIVTYNKNTALSFSEKIFNKAGWINNGCYLLRKQIFGSYQGVFSMEKDMFPDLVKQNQLYIFQTAGNFYDIGVPEDYYMFIRNFSEPNTEGVINGI
ncbi:MAG: NTP transferase domain-containing protein [Nitrospirae bacterium]|nr:NTP transferase domain-containing protein [Nitrospirota bacterium]